MASFKKLILLSLLLLIAAAAGLAYWAFQPIHQAEKAIDFSIRPGSGVRSLSAQIAEAGVPQNPMLFELLVRASGQGCEAEGWLL